MKNKQFSLLIVLFIIISSSCSTNDEQIIENNKNKDPLIGTWNLMEFSNIQANECESKTTYTFKDDLTYTYKEYRKSNNVCSEVKTSKGEWKNNGNNVYYLKTHGYTSGTETTFEFSNNNTIAKFANVTYKKK